MTGRSDLTFFLERARNGFGVAINAHTRARLLAAAERPSEATWAEAYGVVLNGSGMTLWQAVAELYPGLGTYVKADRWHNRPSGRQVVVAIRYATS